MEHEVILDIRTPQEYEQGHLQGAVLVPTPLPPLDELRKLRLRENLRRAMDEVPKERKVYVYCKKGKRAGVASDIIKTMGYDATNLGGVEDGWLSQQLRTRAIRLVR